MRKRIKLNTTHEKRSDKSDRNRSIRCNLCISAMLISVILGGCTRREQLILEDVSVKQEQSSDLQMTEEQTGSETLDSMGQDTADMQNSHQQSSEQSVSKDSGEPQTIFVHVCGAVINPDVYELPTGSRVYEAVQAAGGFAEDADTNYVNQAQALGDGVKLVIPTLEQTAAMMSDGDGESLVGIVGEQGGQGASATASGGQSEVSDGKININTASEAELCNIPGIGAVRAAAIVAYRQEKGGFSSIEDIMNVDGIKEGTYEKIKDSIKIN